MSNFWTAWYVLAKLKIISSELGNLVKPSVKIFCASSNLPSLTKVFPAAT